MAEQLIIEELLARIAKLELENSTKEKVIVEQKKEIMEKEQQYTEVKEKIGKTIDEHGFPILKKFEGSSNIAHEHKKLEPLEPTLGQFNKLNHLKLKTGLPSALWLGSTPPNILLWSTEANIQSFCKALLQDITNMLQKDSEIQFLDNIQVLGKAPDLWVIWMQQQPIGVVEVKKPQEGVLNSPYIFAQIYDYLLLLKNCYGVQQPFGILSTYEEWRIVWLESGNLLAASDELTSTPNFTSYDPRQGIDLNGFSQFDGPSETEISTIVEDLDIDVVKPKIFCSEIYTLDLNWELVKILSSALLKMQTSPIQPVSLGSPGSTCLYVTLSNQGFQYDYKRIPFDFSFQFGFPRGDCTKFFLHFDLGAGAHGRAWLASNNNGFVCVVKLLQNKNQENQPLDAQEIPQEICVWKKIWPHKKRIPRYFECKDERAIVMPYFRPCSESERVKLKGAVCEAVKLLSENKIQHDDLSWRHVGLYDLDGKTYATLFDFGKVSFGQNPPDAFDNMMQKLYPETTQPTVLPTD